MRSVGCKLLTSSSYRLQTQGLVERYHHTLKQALRIYLHNTTQNKWDQYLSYLIFALNATYKRSIRGTSFELVFLKEPPSPLDVEIPTLTKVKDVDRAKQAELIREQARLPFWKPRRYTRKEKT